MIIEWLDHDRDNRQKLQNGQQQELNRGRKRKITIDSVFGLSV